MVTKMSKNVKVLDWTPFAYENITVTTDAVSRLTEAHRNDAGAIFITLEDNDIHYRVDSGDPTAILGHRVISTANQNLFLGNGSAIRNLRMLALNGNALIKVTYYRKRS